MNVAEIGKLIGEEVAKKPEICWYPGGFKPPHKGHLAAAQQLAAKPYITQVNVLIGHGKRDGSEITAKQSKAIWDIYLKAQPNPKIKVDIATTKSPIRDLYRWFGDDLNREAYVAAAGKEVDDLKYFEGLKEAFGDRVQEEIIDDQFVDSDGDRVSGTDFRATIAELRQRYLQVKNNPGDKKALNDYNTTYNYFKSLFPEAVIQKGYLDDVQRVLGINFPEPASLQEGTQPNPKKQPQWVWLEYKSQNKLNPLIFDTDDKVDPKVKELLLKVANYFWEGLEIPEPFEDILLTGSSVNYNYTPTSDIDLHIVVDFDKFENPELLKKYFDEAKVNWNRVHDLKLGKQNIEVYIQDNEDHPEYRGEYSLMNDKWLRKPSFIEINIPDEEIEKKAKLFKQQIDKLEKIGKNNPEKAIELTNKIKERLKNFRQTGLDEDGEYSLENLAFKNLRNTGYLEKLSNLKNSFIDKTLSLNESVDKNSLFEKFMTYACNELQIQNPPSFEIRYEYGEDQPSFGAYVPSKHHIFVNPSNRNIVDVLRTLAHELVHAKQNEMGLLRPDSGETGSEHENDANAIAGILMRDYGKQNPSIYSIGMLNESIKKTAGVWDTNEKFKDGSDFKIKFKVSDIIDLAKNTPVKEIDPKSVNYDFSGREENPTKTKDRVNKADLTYPIIVVKNEKGKIFAMLDGTHRLEKALNLGLNKIKTKILNKEDLIQFKTDKLNEVTNPYKVEWIEPTQEYFKQELSELLGNPGRFTKQEFFAPENYDAIYSIMPHTFKTIAEFVKDKKIENTNEIKDILVNQSITKTIISKMGEWGKLKNILINDPQSIKEGYNFFSRGQMTVWKGIDPKTGKYVNKVNDTNYMGELTNFLKPLKPTVSSKMSRYLKKVGDEEGSKDLPVFAGNIDKYREFAKKGETRKLPAPFVVKYFTKKDGDDYVLIGGFKRSSIALQMGIEPIKVWFIDLTKSNQNENLKEEKQINPPITRIYFDLDGVLAGFDDQFKKYSKKYNKENLDFKSYIGKYGANKAWDIINKGKVKFWSTMPWNPGGQELYNKVMELADEKGFEVWILSSPGLDPNGDAKKGKNLWVDKHLNIPESRRVYKQAKNKYTEAKPGYMLIDDMGSNVSQFIQAGGTGIKNNPEDSRKSIEKLYKFKYE